MKKKVLYSETAKLFWDRFGISCVECPKCSDFIPNVNPGLLKCPICKFEFTVIE